MEVKEVFKVWTLCKTEWDSDDWYNWSVCNKSMNPTSFESVGVFASKEEALKAFDEFTDYDDTNYTTELTLWESQEQYRDELEEYLTDKGIEWEDVDEKILSDYVCSVSDSLYNDIENKFIEQKTESLNDDDIIIAWEWQRYVGYCRKFIGIFRAKEKGFTNEIDLATGNEECVFRENLSVLLTSKNVEGLTDQELFQRIMEELGNGTWKWNNSYTWQIEVFCNI